LDNASVAGLVSLRPPHREDDVNVAGSLRRTAAGVADFAASLAVVPIDDDRAT